MGKTHLSDTGETTLTMAAKASMADLRVVGQDLCSHLFPHSGEAPSEELLASVRLTLNRIVAGIEQALSISNDNDEPVSWSLLSRSGLLRETVLIDFCLARIAECRIRARTDRPAALLAQLPAQLIHDPDPLLSSAARNVLVNDNMMRRFDGRSLFRQLPPELLHMLSWRIVAVLKTEQPNSVDAYSKACVTMLAKNDDAMRAQISAAKLVYFLPDAHRHQLADPVTAGLSLFMGALSIRTGLQVDTIYRLIDGEAVEPVWVILRACAFDADKVGHLIAMLRGIREGDGDYEGLLQSYRSLTVADAAASCFSWLPESS